MNNPFIFIIGCPRSGTTLLQRIVNAHPQIAIIPEIGWIVKRYQNREFVTEEGLVRPGLIEDLLEKGGLGRYTRLPMDRQELEELLSASRHRPVAYSDLITAFFDRYGEAQGKALVGNKTVDYVRSISALHELWPQARFVHLIRDGRDVCLSAIQWRRAARLSSEFGTWS
ncbi:MAG TPA: sulfotransferase, partial [Anaerolineales bacterium]|nr:sulfotransferase [Anaerolineales bacterium]